MVKVTVSPLTIGASGDTALTIIISSPDEAWKIAASVMSFYPVAVKTCPQFRVSFGRVFWTLARVPEVTMP